MRAGPFRTPTIHHTTFVVSMGVHVSRPDTLYPRSSEGYRCKTTPQCCIHIQTCSQYYGCSSITTVLHSINLRDSWTTHRIIRLREPLLRTFSLFRLVSMDKPRPFLRRLFHRSNPQELMLASGRVLMLDSGRVAVFVLDSGRVAVFLLESGRASASMLLSGRVYALLLGSGREYGGSYFKFVCRTTLIPSYSVLQTVVYSLQPSEAGGLKIPFSFIHDRHTPVIAVCDVDFKYGPRIRYATKPVPYRAL